MVHRALLAVTLAGCGVDAASVPDGPFDGATADAGLLDAPPATACGALPTGITSGTWGTPVPGTGPSTRAVVLMGGGPEVDEATRVFVGAARGGDVLVIRATGSVDSYTKYFSTDLTYAPPPSSVETLRVDVPSAAAAASVRCRLAAAEALWLPGGDQWHYLGLWPPAFSAAFVRDVPTGGTSAGAMSLGEWAFTAERGSVTSAEALADPLGPSITVAESPYAQLELGGWLVDTHFDTRNREGRLLTFLARMPLPSFGIGIAESTALVIEGGRYRVHGSGTVSLYSASGPAILAPGAPLSLDNIRRARLPRDSVGPWPPDFTTLPTTRLRVTAGNVETL